jgi:hypothetical protein
MAVRRLPERRTYLMFPDMGEKIHFNAYRYEFGNAISCGLLMPYNCRRAGIDAHTWTRMCFPPAWTSSWFGLDGWHQKMDKPQAERQLGDKRDMERYVFGERALTDFEPLPIPAVKRNMKERYVVLIPTLDSHAKGNHHKLELCLDKAGWTIVADGIRSMGMRVVTFTSDEACDEVFAQSIADVSFHANKNKLEPNTFLCNQLEWMKNAATSVAMGGAFHVAFTFDVPGIGYDGQMVKNYTAISRSYTDKQRPLKILPSANGVARRMGMDAFKVDKSVASVFYTEYAKVICGAVQAACC